MAGFMAGFGSTFANLIEEDRKYYRDAAAKRRDYIQTYGTRAVIEREDKANAALGVANMLMDRGFSKEYVTSIAANNGVRSMVDFADQISKRTDLTEKDIKEIEASAKDFVKDNPDEDLSTVVKRAYGLYKSTKDPVARKRNIFGAMLGLDASMMEDDVLNDMYIDGYTGSDIYRIMGSAGPGAGKPMGVKLPPKPYTFRQNNDFLTVSMVPNLENFLEQEKSYVKNVLAGNPGEEVAKNATALNTELTGIENLIKSKKYSEAMQKYLELDNIQYSSSFLGSLQQLDERMPGAVTRNPLLTEGFLATYKKEIGDIKDDAAAAETTVGTSGTQEPKGDGKVAEPPKGDGKVAEPPKGDGKVAEPPKGDGKVDEPPKKTTHKVTSEAEALELLQSGEVKVGDDIDINGTIRPVTRLPESSPKTTDLGDMSGAPGFRERDDVSVAMTQELQEASDAVKDTLPEDLQAEFDSFINEEGGALAFNSILSDEPLPEDVQAELEKFESEEVPSVMDYIKNFRGVRSGLTLAEKFANPLFFLDPQYYVGTVEPGLTLGAAQEKTVTRAFDTEERQVLEDYIRAAQRRGYKPTSEDLKEIKNVLNRATDTPAYKQLQEIIAERTGVSLEETEAEIEKLIKEDPQSIASAMLYGKAQDTESGAGTFTGEPTIGEAPDIQTMARSGTLGDTRTDADPTLPASMTVEQMTTRGKKATPSGLMSPPSSGTAPKLGQAEFGDLIDRVHGSSKAAETFNNKVSSGKVTAADVTRLIKATRKLPNTKSKDNLLQSLFDLRDALNKR